MSERVNMKSFDEYFSFDALLGDLVRWRVAGKKGVETILPPRKSWMREGCFARKKKSPEAIRRHAIVRRVNRERAEGTLESTVWGQKLVTLVANVRNSVFAGEVSFEAPRMIKILKGSNAGRTVFRDVASFERLEDKLILSRVTAYVRDVLEGVLCPNCYSFRLSKDMSHKKAIEDLQEWKAGMLADEVWVAECDIRKFFDNISHDVVRRAWRAVGEDRLDSRAERVLEAYLNVYSSSEGTERGLPQGGSFSTVLANLVLHKADISVLGAVNNGLFYARYCDDVIIASAERSDCERGMAAYAEALRALDLPMHPVEAFEYVPADGTSTTYYTIKSKGPFKWYKAEKGEKNVAPWVSFLGCHIRYDGDTRIRKESIEKHIHSLGQETAKTVREIGRGALSGLSLATRRAWFARFRNRLIAKGVGYVTAKVIDCDMCWAGGFPGVTICKETEIAMRRLDRIREGMLAKVWRCVREGGRSNRGHTPGRLTDSGALGTTHPTERRFKGRPFSYYAFLHKAVRPSNMALLRRTMRTLPYSEL